MKTANRPLISSINTFKPSTAAYTLHRIWLLLLNAMHGLTNRTKSPVGRPRVHKTLHCFLYYEPTWGIYSNSIFGFMESLLALSQRCMRHAPSHCERERERERERKREREREKVMFIPRFGTRPLKRQNSK